MPDEVATLSFEDVSDRAVRVVWAPPTHPNGILTGYQLTYEVKDKPETRRVHNLSADASSHRVTQLQATTHYTFRIVAFTSVGGGSAKVATIQSGVEPVLPEAPSKLALSNIEAFSVVVQFTPGFDGNSSISKWTVEAQTARNATWFVVCEVREATAAAVTVRPLVPFTVYRLRLVANNVVGASAPSDPTKEFQTLQAPPSHPPLNVTVRAMSATELRVRWIPLQQVEWFGNARGYEVVCSEFGTLSPPPTRTVVIDDPTANSVVVDGLEEFAEYGIAMRALNDVGASAASPRYVERTRESVPSFGPMGVEANATSSTTVVVRWGEVPREHRNGLIEGYKVLYGASARLPFAHKLIAGNATFTATLTELRKFVQYHVQVLAYTRLGDGAPSTPAVRVRTFEDAPGPPSNVSFPDVSATTARVIWDVPDEPNGEILAYRVTYALDGVDAAGTEFSKEFAPSDRTYRAGGLLADRYYAFTVTAQTRLGWGETARALVYTTANREPPQQPSAPVVSRGQVRSDAITFSWTPGRDGFAPLRYYTVEQSENGGPWQRAPRRLDPHVAQHTARGLRPDHAYRFRIQATNDIGPSPFSLESAQVRTLPDAPSRAVRDVRAVPITTTSVEVRWTAIEARHWSGDSATGGYRVLYQPLADDFPAALAYSPKEDVPGAAASSLVLADLQHDRYYEIVVVAYNSQGDGPPSRPVTVYVGEAVPTGEPRAFEGEPVSSTEVRLRWKPPQPNMQNGDLLGT